MPITSGVSFSFTPYSRKAALPFSNEQLYDTTTCVNEYLAKLPGLFDSTIVQFYKTLNQRNLSGFIGEVYKHVLHSICPDFVPNPHPDGRPDMLYLKDPEVRKYFKEACFEPSSGAPIREALAPFHYGGVEIKSSIGNTPDAGELEIGQSRSQLITGLNYWAHHAHACTLLGIYYDYCNVTNNSPQIKGLVYCDVIETDWNKVSIGRPDKKKTSNTSLNKTGVAKLRESLIMFSDEPDYIKLFKRLEFL